MSIENLNGQDTGAAGAVTSPLSTDLVPAADASAAQLPVRRSGQVTIREITWEEVQGMAQVIHRSGIWSKKFRSYDAIVAMMLFAQSEGLHPMQAVRRYHFIEGGAPSMSAEAMLASFQAAGGWVEWLDRSDESVSAVFHHPNGRTVTPVQWTLDDARRAGLLGKGTWQKHPRQMLTSRVISEGVRATMPEVVLGIYGPDEAEEIIASDGDAGRSGGNTRPRAGYTDADRVASPSAGRAPASSGSQQQQQRPATGNGRDAGATGTGADDDSAEKEAYDAAVRRFGRYADSVIPDANLRKDGNPKKFSPRRLTYLLGEVLGIPGNTMDSPFAGIAPNRAQWEQGLIEMERRAAEEATNRADCAGTEVSDAAVAAAAPVSVPAAAPAAPTGPAAAAIERAISAFQIEADALGWKVVGDTGISFDMRRTLVLLGSVLGTTGNTGANPFGGGNPTLGDWKGGLARLAAYTEEQDAAEGAAKSAAAAGAAPDPFAEDSAPAGSTAVVTSDSDPFVGIPAAQPVTANTPRAGRSAKGADAAH